jgi:hypothetical protein
VARQFSKKVPLAFLLVYALGVGPVVAADAAHAGRDGKGIRSLVWKTWRGKARAETATTDPLWSGYSIPVTRRKVIELITDDPSVSYHYKVLGTLAGKPVRFDLRKNRWVVQPDGSRKLFDPYGREVEIPASRQPDRVARIFDPRRVSLTQEDPASRTFEIADTGVTLPRGTVRAMWDVKVATLRHSAFGDLPQADRAIAPGSAQSAAAAAKRLDPLVKAWTDPARRQRELDALGFRPMTLDQARHTLPKLRSHYGLSSDQWFVGVIVGQLREEYRGGSRRPARAKVYEFRWRGNARSWRESAVRLVEGETAFYHPGGKPWHEMLTDTHVRFGRVETL